MNDYAITKRDITYVDSTRKIVQWSYRTPGFGLNIQQKPCLSNVHRLTHLASKKVVEHIEELNPELITSVPWTAWAHVWDEICNQGVDSYQLFLQFVKHLNSPEQFMCHGRIDLAQYSSNVRQKFLACNLLAPEKYRHRIEYMVTTSTAANDNVFDTYLHTLLQTEKLKHIILLDLSGVKMDRDSLISLMSLSSLVGLDVSGCNVYEHNVLPFWKSAMHSGRWARLQLLCLGTDTGPSSHQSLADFETLFDIPTLFYLEGYKLQHQNQCWKSIRDVKLASTFTKKYGLAWKLQYVYKRIRAQQLPNNIYHDIHLGTEQVWQPKKFNGAECYFRISTSTLEYFHAAASHTRPVVRGSAQAAAPPSRSHKVVKKRLVPFAQTKYSRNNQPKTDIISREHI